MKKIIFLIVTLVLSISTVGCTTVKVADVESIKSPDNNNLIIKGVWEIKDTTILDQSISNELKNIDSNKIIISENEIILGSKEYINPKYKLKVVDKNYILSYELNLSINNIIENCDSVDTISVIYENNTIGEFILKNDKEGYFFVDGVTFELEKTQEDVTKYINENKGIEETETKVAESDYYNNVGVMIALKSPRKLTENGTYSMESYRTLWISFKDGKLQPIIEKANIIFPRINGIWTIENDVFSSVNNKYEYFNTYQMDGKNMSWLPQSIDDSRYKDITFISNDYIGIKKYDVDEPSVYQVVPVDNINSYNGVTIDEIFTNDAMIKYENDFKNALQKVSEGKKEELNREVDYSNFTMKRIDGKWKLIGKLTSNENYLNDIDFKISLNPNKKLLNYDTLLISWKDLKSKFPFVKDAFTAPTGRITTLFFEEHISIYEMEDRQIKGNPLMNVDLNEGEEVIMAEWCSGSYVDSWAKAFKDGKEISKR